MLFARPFLAFAAAAALFGQDAARPSFEVASVKPSVPLEGDAQSKEIREKLMDLVAAQTSGSGIRMMDKGRVSLKRQTLATLIAGAYTIQADQVEGPAWIRELRFDIEAKMPEGADRAVVPQMMQTLLAERFALRVHLEDREAAGYAVVVAKGGPKLTPAGNSEEAPKPVDMDTLKAQTQARMEKAMAENRAQMMSDGGGMGGSSSRWSDPQLTMEKLASRLSASLRKPVVDATGLTGQYNVTLSIVRPADEDLDSATQRGLAPLGLKLESRKLPVKVVVVESANKTPTEN